MSLIIEISKKYDGGNKSIITFKGDTISIDTNLKSRDYGKYYDTEDNLVFEMWDNIISYLHPDYQMICSNIN